MLYSNRNMCLKYVDFYYHKYDFSNDKNEFDEDDGSYVKDSNLKSIRKLWKNLSKSKLTKLSDIENNMDMCVPRIRNQCVGYENV